MLRSWECVLGKDTKKMRKRVLFMDFFVYLRHRINEAVMQ